MPSTPPQSRSVVRPSGPCPAPVYLLGEAPGRQEVKQGYGWAGRAGDELWHALSILETGLDRRTVRVGNVCWSWPGLGNPDPTPEMLEHWREEVRADICETDPQVIVALGRFAADWCLPHLELDLSWDAGLLLPTPSLPCPVIVSGHPAAALHSPDLYRLFFRGMERLAAWVRGAQTPLEDAIPSPTYVGAASAEQATRSRLTLPTAIDTEFGPDGDPLGASWACVEGVGTWADGWAPHLATGLLHNALADLAMIDRLGGRVEQVEDTMVMAHICGEPLVGLKPLAWRLCGMQLSDYEDVVKPAQDRVAREWLQGLAAQYEPQYEERVSEKTGKVLKPKLLPKSRFFKAVERCLRHEEPHRLWRDQAAEIQREGHRRAGGGMPVATLADVTDEKETA